MDDGWKLLYRTKLGSGEEISIFDEREYYPVYIGIKQIAAFKESSEAMNYVYLKVKES